MKRAGGLWETLVSFSNLALAARKAARGKRGLANVAQFEYGLEQELCRLQEELKSKTYRPGEYRTFEIFDPKRRMISAAPFRDRVVHHALCRVLEPIFERSFIHDSYASRPRKGTHAALNRFTEFARRNRFVLKCDVSKFFPSIDHEILKLKIRRKIKDPDVLWLADLIIDHSNPQEPVIDWFPGDALWTPYERRRGLPIGNQTSQFFANVYLDSLDHFVLERLQLRGYIRYCDDFVAFSNDSGELAKARGAILAHLDELRLKLHPRKNVISRVEDGTRFLGYRVHPQWRRLDRANVVRMKRRLRALQAAFAAFEITPKQIRQRLTAWIGHAKHADTFRLRQRLFRETTFSRSARTPKPVRQAIEPSCGAGRLLEQ